MEKASKEKTAKLKNKNNFSYEIRLVLNSA
jgi:hypothetical protein